MCHYLFGNIFIQSRSFVKVRVLSKIDHARRLTIHLGNYHTNHF